MSLVIKKIRSDLNLSKSDFANVLGVSFGTINRWENGHCKPSKIALNAIRNLCIDNNIDLSPFENKNVIELDETITLYHGSKSGIHGAIAPLSRRNCDFGKGFYMGTNRIHQMILNCNSPHAKLYTLRVDLRDLKILNVEVGLDWALLVAFNRGKMEHIKDSIIYNYYANLSKDCDMIIGFIADDRMFVVLDRFFNGEITDIALIHSLSALNLGKQSVALSKKACGKIKIIKEEIITDEEREKLKVESIINRSKGVALADEVCRKYRREGRYFDEILEDGG